MQTQGPRQRGASGPKEPGSPAEANVDSEEQRLDAMLAALARGAIAAEAWDELHAAARRSDRTSELAFAFESVSQGKRLKTAPPALAAEFLFQAARFFGHVMRDELGAISYLQRALALAPAHAASFSKLEELLDKSQQYKKLADLYVAAAQQQPRGDQAPFLRHAVELLVLASGPDDKLIELLQQVLRLEPGDGPSQSLLESLFLKANRFRDVVRLDEQALASDPAPNAETRTRLLARIVELYAEKLREPERALPYIEQLLVLDPAHAVARAVARRLIAVRGLAGRAAAALATAHEATGDSDQVAQYLALELESTRGTKRAQLLARLGRLKQDHLGDAIGAFETFEQALAMDADDDVRTRYVALAGLLRRDADAAKTLARLLAGVKDSAVRAKTGADLGKVLRRNGETKRAKAPLIAVLSAAGAPDEAVLSAAYVLWEILEVENDARWLCEVLERIASIEPDLEKRRRVDERLSELATKLNDVQRAIPAFERLLGTSSRAMARQALGPLYQATGATLKHAGLLEDQANEAGDAVEARSLLMKAAQIRANEAKDVALAIATCESLIQRFGPAHDVLALLTPLLEAQRRWGDLASALFAEASLYRGRSEDDGAPADDASKSRSAARARVLARMGLVKLSRLHDAQGAIEAMNEALACDPSDKTARATLEKLAAAGEHRLAAARALEPFYRREGARAPLLRVLDLRGSLAADPDDRLAALRESADLSASEVAATGGDTARALDLVARGFAEAVGSMKPTGEWLERLDRVARPGIDSARRAAVLAGALGDREVTTVELSALAKRAAGALAEAGDGRAAIALYRRALAFEPHSTVLLLHIDDLLRDQGSPSERIALHRAALRALPEKGDHARRQELLHRIGSLERGDLGDAAAAIETYHAALDNNPDDAAARDALEELYVQAGRFSDLCALLEGKILRLQGDAARAVRVKLAKLGADQGDVDTARRHCEHLLADPDLTPEHLRAVERAAEKLADADLLGASLKRRADMAASPSEQIAWLDKLGVLDQKRRGDSASAAASWKRAAGLAEAMGDESGARRLYALSRKAAPEDVEVTARLTSLCERAALWEELPRLYVALANQSGDDEERVNLALRAAEVQSERLNDVRSAARSAGRAFELAPGRADVLAVFERLSLAAGGMESFERTVTGVLSRPDAPSNLGTDAHARILLSRARMLASDASGADDASEAYRAILDDDRFAAYRPEALEMFESLLSGRGDSDRRRADRRWLLDWHARHAPDQERVRRWLAWAREEETTFMDADRAIALYVRVLGVEPGCYEALSSLARLALATGKTDDALSALSSLRDRSEGASRVAIEREIARVLATHDLRYAEALPSLRAVLADAPSDPEALALSSRLLAHPETRAEACALLERACDATEDEGARTRILTALLDATSGPPLEEPWALRAGWFERLCTLQRGCGLLDAALATALRAARETPNAPASWDRAEALARDLSRPDEVAALYEEVLARPLGREHTVAIGERAVQFYEEWFEDAGHLVRILDRVLDVDPAAGWAFDRLKLLLDAAERWDDLFAAYDRALGAATGEERSRLLEDAAQTAKDFADRPERAIGYLEQLRVLRPSDGKLGNALERLYEREGKHRELVFLLTARLPTLDAEESRRARTRVATLWLDALFDPGPALDVLEPLLERETLANNRLAAETVLLLERILAQSPKGAPTESVPPPASDPGRPRRGRTSEPPPLHRSVRQRAAAWLREHYAAAESDSDLARMLLVELETMSRPKDRVRRHVQVAELFERVGDLPNAFVQTSLAVIAAPGDDALRSRLSDLAERSGLVERLAEVMAAAASVAETASLCALLTLEAASLRAERLGDAPGAIVLLSPLLTDRSVSDEDALAAAGQLEPLLEAAGRVEERLAVVERIAAVTREPQARRDALGRAAGLAVEIGQDARAIALWEAALAMNDRDADALDSLIDLLGRETQYERLVEVLDNRARVATAAAARRSDLVRVAAVLSDVLDRPARAVDAWRAIEAEFGEADDATSALAALFRATERWQELAELLERSAHRSAQATERADRLSQLGDVRRERLRDPRAAIAAYAAALAEDAGHGPARAGLLSLTNDDAQRAEAISVLLAALGESDDWRSILALTPQRLLSAHDTSDKLSILRSAAKIAEERAGDVTRAFDAMRRAFIMAPGDAGLQAEVMRLAEAAGSWAEVVAAHGEAIDGAAREDAQLCAQLWRTIGATRELRLNDPKGALDAYLRVIAGTTDADTMLAAARVAAGLGQWDVAARVLVDWARAVGSAPGQGLDELERASASASAWDEATRALTEAVSSGDLRGPAARDIAARVARWHLEKRADENAAEAALERALLHDDSNVALLSSLAQLRRRRPDRRLVETLVALSGTAGGSLSLLREASEVASSNVGDRALALELAGKTLDLARACFWGAGREHAEPEGGDGKDDPRAAAEWAIETLARLHDHGGDAQAVLDVLTLGEALPFDLSVRHGMRRRAARTALDRLNDADRAIALYWPLFDHDPRDTEAVERLATVYTAKGRTGDLLRMRTRQIEVAEQASERVALRLEAGRLLGELGEGARAVEMLRANFEDDPGHAATVEKLAATLALAARNEELRDLLASQAEYAERAGNSVRAADLWGRAASAAEDLLGQPEAAAGYHARVVAVAKRAASLEALARLAQDKGDHVAAASWLEKWLEVEPEQRVGATLRLAEALIFAGQSERAAERLEQSLVEAPASEPLRARLAAIYRAQGDLPKLARATAEAAVHAPDKSTRMEKLLLAAELFAGSCGQPERAVPLLEQASELSPEDQTVRLSLANALAQAGRHDDARAILRSLIDAFGGRRPRERAPVHYQMARLELAADNRARALMELDTAARVDPQNPEILGTLAQLARDDGQLERAEKSYRALLVILRRSPASPNGGRDTAGGSSYARGEVLLELSLIAEQRGESERAREILESAFEAAAESEFERERLENRLRERGAHATLVRALELRLARLGDAPEAAHTLSELADVLVDRLDRPGQALDVRVRAVAADPRSDSVHAAALALARALGHVEAYFTGASGLVEAAVANGDGPLACDLLVRLAAVAETDLGDSRRAAALCERAVSLGGPSPEVLRALDRVYERLGESDDQARVLAMRVEMETAGGRLGAASEALYKLATLRLASARTLDEGAQMLGRALDLDPKFEVAERALRRAAAIDPTHAGVLALYERVGRAPGQETALVEALSLRARLGGAGADVVREAVSAASRAGHSALAESLLTGFAAQATTVADGASLAWALGSLANLRQAAGDLRGAVEQKRRAAQAADPEVARRLHFEIARIAAGDLDDLDLAAEALEAIHQADPSDREAWEPLAEVYRRRGDADKLVAMLGSVVDYVDDLRERTRMRLERVRTMIDRLDLGDAEAEPKLREILDDDPSQVEAALMLAKILERAGKRDELAELLARQVDSAKDRGDAPSIASLTGRLGALLEPTDRVQARNVYYAGLDWEPTNRDLLDALLRLLSGDEDAAERADVLERRLALEQGPGAEPMALALFALRTDAGDASAAARALDMGYRAHPASETLRVRLSDLYRSRGEFRRLAELCVIDAGLRDDAGERVARLREAAAIYRTELSDAREAAAVLRLARTSAPLDAALLRDEIDLWVEAGDPAAATAVLNRTMGELPPADPRRAELLAVRATLRQAASDAAGALDDLEAAFVLDGASYGARLVAELQSAIESSDAAGDRATSHARRLRHANVLIALGDDDSARRVLVNMVRQEPKDRDALRALAALEMSRERWETAGAVWKRLVGVEAGQAALDAVLALADVCARAGRPADARGALERARLTAPHDRAVRESLERVYEGMGAWHELARMALEDAQRATDVEERFALLVRAGAWLLRRGEDPARAEGALKEALALRPADPECVALLVDAYLMSTRVSEAAALLETVMAPEKGRRSRELSPLYWRVARVAREQADLAGEMRALALAVDSDSQNGDVCASVALRALELDERELATRALRAITMLKTPGPMSRALAYQHLGDIAQKQGDSRRALTLLRRAVTEDPGLESARSLMNALVESQG